MNGNGKTLAEMFSAFRACDAAGFRMAACGRGSKEPYMVGWTAGLGVEDMTEIQSKRPSNNFGVLTGKVSDDQFCIDLDNSIAVELADQHLPPTGLIVGRKQNPRTHWFYHVPSGIKATKFKLPADPNDKEKKLTVVEVLGDGNQVIVGPSVHPSGDVYDILEGEPAEVDGAELLEAVESLFNAVLDRLGLIPDEKPKPNSNGRSQNTGGGSGLSPGKDFDERGDVRELLQRHGWTRIGSSGNDERWRRPGKDHGISATLKDGRLFYCFTSSAAGLDGGKAYGPFGLFTALECSGDFHQAHEKLKVLGFGEFGWRLLAQNNAGGEQDRGGACDTTPKNSEKIEVLSRVATVTTPQPSPIEPFRAFPVDVLPEPIGEVVRRVSKAMGCDPSFVALPALSVLAGAIGNSRRIRLKYGWTEPVIVWTGIVGESGTLKSPPLEWLTQPLRDREESALERYATALEEFAAEQLRHAAAVAAWKQRKSSEPPPLTPVPPVCSRSFTSDTTIEAVCVMLADNPRGMILIRDELAGWVSAFDQYKSKAGGDAAHWLSIHSAKGFVVDRKTGDRKTIFVARPAMSVTGGIQPATLRRVLAEGHVENGLAARLLFSFPPRHPKRWTEADISPAIEAKWKTAAEQPSRFQRDHPRELFAASRAESLP